MISQTFSLRLEILRVISVVMSSRAEGDSHITADPGRDWCMSVEKWNACFMVGASRVGSVLCNASAGHHRRRKLSPVPMRLLRWGIPSILHNTCVFCREFFRLCTLLPLYQFRGGVGGWGNLLHKLRFLCIVEVELRGIHCEFSRLLVSSVDR
jgi:hypothetical protein